ncbi:MAG: RdgB/HAM1 family non-canonical purine NTP pyrophosphatase [Actinomycetota bacterium]
MTTRFVLATANPDKAEEIERILADAGAPVELAPRPAEVGEVEETGTTLEDNARLKALALVVATGLPAIADDTGLEVDALGGAPGVHSARFAGPDATYADNCALLLTRLAGVAPEHRTARFTTVAVARWPDGREVVASGSVEGRITETARGERGFGYDPVFAPGEGGGATFAELTAAEKHAISHRGRAFRTLGERLSVLAEVGDC